jgi:hypothetical protein
MLEGGIKVVRNRLEILGFPCFAGKYDERGCVSVGRRALEFFAVLWYSEIQFQPFPSFSAAEREVEGEGGVRRGQKARFGWHMGGEHGQEDFGC